MNRRALRGLPRRAWPLHRGLTQQQPGAGQQASPDDDGYGPAGEAGGGYNDVIPDWSRTKVHVGKHAGHELRELTEEAIRLLIEKWGPAAMAKGKLTADDQRLMEAMQSCARTRSPSWKNSPSRSLMV